MIGSASPVIDIYSSVLITFFIFQAVWSLILFAMVHTRADRAGIILSTLTIIAGSVSFLIFRSWIFIEGNKKLKEVIIELLTVGGGIAILAGTVTLIICLVKMSRARINDQL